MQSVKQNILDVDSLILTSPSSDVVEFLCPSNDSFSLLLNLILSELRRLGGTGGGVFSIDESDDAGDMHIPGLGRTLGGVTGGGER